LDRRELVDLLEALCARPFADEAAQPSDVRDSQDLDVVHHLAQTLTDADAGPSDAGSEDAALGTLAAILSGTATEAQCRAFREAAGASATLRAEAQSALAFIDAVEAAPRAAPAHLLAQILPTSVEGAQPADRPRPWRWRASYWSAAAAGLVMLFGIGLSAPLLWQVAPATRGTAVVPASVERSIALPAGGVEPERSPASQADVAPAAPVPTMVPAMAPRPPSAAVESAAVAPADPCAPTALGRAAGVRTLRPPPTAQSKMAVASAPEPPKAGCADADRTMRPAQVPARAGDPSHGSDPARAGDPSRGNDPAAWRNRSAERSPFALPAGPTVQPPAAAYAPER
jgi:hypothetical protein